MYQLLSINSIKPKWNQEIFLLAPQDVKQEIRLLRKKNIGEKQNIFVALILYEVFKLKSSLENISMKYDVACDKLIKLQGEVTMYANMMISFSKKIGEASLSIDLIEGFKCLVKGTKKTTEASISPINCERPKRTRSSEVTELLPPAKRTMNDNAQQNKENTKGKQDYVYNMCVCDLVLGKSV